MGVGDVSKRILLGRKLRSSQLGETLLPKRIALPVFASDALSSVAYAPDEVFIMLSVAGVSAYAYSWKIGVAVAIVMLTVVASYRQNVHAYPSGGGDYEVATVNLGKNAGVTVAAALLVDYVLTVAVSVSSGVQNASSALPFMQHHETTFAVLLVMVLAAMNLRGVRESGAFFAIPTYGFMVGVLGMAVYGVMRALAGDLPQVESASLNLAPDPSYAGDVSQVALIFLLARAFSSGCAALTGVEAISNGVPAFRKPKSRNAATTLLLLGGLAVTMLLSLIILAREMGLKYVDPNDLERLTRANGDQLPAGYDQHTVIAQVSRAIFDNFPPGFYFLVAMTGIILILAANTAFNGFPVLGSILAKDGFMPRALGSRGDRLAYSNGILILAGFAIVLIVAFRAEPTRLIQLYIVGVFVSFNLSQLGMIRHWTRHLKGEKDHAERRRMYRSRAINTFGLGMTAVVFVVVLLTKFLSRRLDRDPGDDRVLRDHEGHPPALRAGLRRAGDRRVRPGAAHACPRDRAGLEAAQADDARAGVREGDPPERPRGRLRRHRRQGHRPAAGGVGQAPDRRPAEGPLLAVPRDHPADRDVRDEHPRGQPARRGGGLHPGVRGRALVGAAAPQPDGAAAQGPAAVHPGRDGDLRAVPAPVVRDRPRARGVGARPASPGRRPPRPHRTPVSRERRRTRQRTSTRPSRAGERHEVVADAIAHGGHVVARAGGVVVFVRHALPGERVVVEITEGREGDRFLRGDAVDVLAPSPHRVPAPCPYAGPGACGGCDFQHVEPAHQRDLKTAVVREQLSRLAGLEVDVEVEAVEPVLGWRSRMQYVDLPGGARGLRKHRSHEVVAVDRCLIDAGLPPTGVEHVREHTFAVDPDGFWQPHVSAPEVLVDALLEALRPQLGESVVDLYSGVGLFAAFLADVVGQDAGVEAVEGDRRAAAHAADNLGRETVAADVLEWLESGVGPDHADLVVLDPPRTGAKRRVVEGIVRLSPRAVGYVACDPAALARDVAIFAEHGYALTGLRAFDLFPMTHHVECVALLERT